jgi:hypothetical protein
LDDFLWWKGSTHIIEHSNAKGTDRNGLKTTNRGKNEREKRKNTKTKRESQETHHKSNPRGHEVVRATIPTAKLEFLHKSLNLWTSVATALRGGGN